MGRFGRARGDHHGRLPPGGWSTGARFLALTIMATGAMAAGLPESLP